MYLVDQLSRATLRYQLHFGTILDAIGVSPKWEKTVWEEEAETEKGEEMKVEEEKEKGKEEGELYRRSLVTATTPYGEWDFYFCSSPVTSRQFSRGSPI